MFELNLEQKQKLGLGLSQEMQQSIEILTMNSQELTGYLTSFAMENPMVELEEFSPKTRENIQKEQWDWIDRNTVTYSGSASAKGMGNDFAFENMAADRTEDTLYEYLLQQIRLRDDIADKDLVSSMVLLLDQDGYLRITPEEIGAIYKDFANLNDVKEGLEQLKKLEPAGVGAYNLSECLCLQLKAEETLEKEIVTKYLEQLAKGNYEKIASKTGAKQEEVSSAVEKIRKLNPKPGSGFFTQRHTGYVTPDVAVVNYETHFDIIPYSGSYPIMELSGETLRLYKGADEETIKYLDEKKKQVEWVQKALSERIRTLLAVTKAIVAKQQSFFKGSPYLVPLKMSDVAQEIEMHESTVSRAVKGKYLQCAQGIYPLRYFFVQGIGREEESQEGVSSQHIKTKIKALIQSEERAKPLSDQKIADILKLEGISVARRTVAKYREEMNILSSSYRKNK